MREVAFGSGVRCFQHSQMLQTDPTPPGSHQFLGLWHVGAYFPDTTEYVVRIRVEALTPMLAGCGDGNEGFCYVGVAEVFHREKLEWREIHHWCVPTDNPIYTTPTIENFDIVQVAVLRSAAFVLTMRVNMDE